MSRTLDSVTSLTTALRYTRFDTPVTYNHAYNVSQLTEQHGEYLKALKRWANDYLNIQFSAQIGYNMAVDMVSPDIRTSLLRRG